MNKERTSGTEGQRDAQLLQKKKGEEADGGGREGGREAKKMRFQFVLKNLKIKK